MAPSAVSAEVERSLREIRQGIEEGRFPMYPKTWEVDIATQNHWGPIDTSLLED